MVLFRIPFTTLFDKEETIPASACLLFKPTKWHLALKPKYPDSG